MSGSVTPYLNLIPSQNQNAPNFMAMVAATLQPAADMVALCNTVPSLFNVYTAVGQQLDWIGQWVGVSRELSEPLTGVYFSFDTAGVGFDEGVWQGPGNPTTGLVSLPDDYYLLVLLARILNNNWQGDIPDAYKLLNTLFAPFGYTVLIIDNNNLTMRLAILSTQPITPIVIGLLLGGFFDIRPLGVELGYSYGAPPLFAFDLAIPFMAGFDLGNWT